MTGSRPVSEVSPIPAIPRQFSGTGAPRTSSPLARQSYTAPNLSSQSTGITSDWAIPAAEKAQYDAQFSRLDSSKTGFVSGEQAVGFFSNSRLSENDLAQIWDLADITQTGQLNQDEFAVAMHLIRQQLNSKGPLPSTLPQNLIPPSMRQQVSTPQAPPPQAAPPTAPPKPKSAADDLFGLDALTAPAPQVPQSTGDSSSATGPSAPLSTSSPPPQQPSTHFKPFVPSSSFGQSIVSPQPTGATTGSPPSQQSRAPLDDDLLGDADPEVSKKLTNETTELANLSNQVNSLTTQMKEVQTKQIGSKQELSQVANQKRDFETRLAQLRSAYEQEARELKALQDRLATARNDTTKLQQDLALTQHSYQNLQEQEQQIMVGLEADQKENSTLKERIAQVYKETNQIKPQIDKMRSEARQQKGLVAINKKQLSTAEAERDKVKTDLDGATNEYNEATKELEDSKRSLEASQTTIQPSTIASPAPSTSSMNPFFRRTTSMASDKAMAQSPFAAQPAITSPNHSAFDSFFGSALEDTRPFTPSSETKLSDVPRTSQQPLEGQSSSEQTAYTPKSEDSPRFPSTNQPPPPPPHSRQMTPSVLPLRESAQRAPSSTSSVGVIPPASQFGDISEAATPTKDKEAGVALHSNGSDSSSHQPIDQAESIASREVHAPDATTPHEPPSAPPNIPGAFPTDITPVETPISATQREGLGSSHHNDGKTIPPQGDEETRDAFDDAFGGFEGKWKAPITSNAFGVSKQSNSAEFPPIHEFGDDNESDSDDEEAEQRLHNNFPSIAAASEGKLEPASGFSSGEQAKPSLSREISSSSQLPTPNAQKSPPTYGETMSSSEKDGAPRDANKFAAEYTGLLPSREDPTTSPNFHSTEAQPGSSSSNGNLPLTSVTAVENPPPIREQSQPPVPPKTALDDFDSAFGDLSEAQTADDRGDEDFGSSAREGFDDFNPTFDSPAPSQAHSKAPTLDNSGFQDFENSLSGPSQSISASAAGAPTRAGPTKDEWDAMFAGFGSDDASASQTNGDGAQKSDSFLDVFSVPTSGPAAGSAQQSQTLAPPGKPPLTRAISSSTEHDDPFVKQLTGMGYSRDASVRALEKYDYNLDKVCL